MGHDHVDIGCPAYRRLLPLMDDQTKGKYRHNFPSDQKGYDMADGKY
ncbi:hypothetical protein SDC9_154191 [bioreactor metagenome]|uniref:Uncharacterized protein n=1 Tax=bioreactor metagenome TaxID=1076179 RepID=A0A645F2W5_9ZZZZ